MYVVALYYCKFGTTDSCKSFCLSKTAILIPLSIIQVTTQKWVFEFLEEHRVQTNETFGAQWFQLTPEKAATKKYDIIVIGTGMGAGIVAGDLFDTNSRLGENAKSVLVIEKGGLAFHSHCLNAARPSGYGEDCGQQNDTFFNLFEKNYKFEDVDQGALWNGGLMFNVGGRSAAWGLFCPRIHDELLKPSSGKNFLRIFSTFGTKKPRPFLPQEFLPSQSFTTQS